MRVIDDTQAAQRILVGYRRGLACDGRDRRESIAGRERWCHEPSDPGSGLRSHHRRAPDRPGRLAGGSAQRVRPGRGPGARERDGLPAGDAADAVGHAGEAARRQPGEQGADHPAEGTRPQGLAARAAPRLQLLRQDAQAGRVQAGPRPESRGAGHLPGQHPAGHPSGDVSPRQGRRIGSAVRAQRHPGRHGGDQERDDRADLPTRRQPVQEDPRRQGAADSRSPRTIARAGRSCISRWILPRYG